MPLSLSVVFVSNFLFFPFHLLRFLFPDGGLFWSALNIHRLFLLLTRVRPLGLVVGFFCLSTRLFLAGFSVSFFFLDVSLQSDSNVDSSPFLCLFHGGFLRALIISLFSLSCW